MAACAAVDKPRAEAGQPGIQAWAVCTLPLAFLVHLVVFHKQSVSPRTWTLLMPIFLAGASFAWLSAVSKTVPQPYLDEVFHIPQAQKYCHGRFGEWDDKITTPPGLYLFSNLLPHVASKTGLSWAYSCDANNLRAVNTVGLFVLAYLFLLCRHQIEGLAYDRRSSSPQKWPFSEYAFHSACNAALFPLLFFFSGLYYTDVISTAVVLGAFLNHLSRVGCGSCSIQGDILTVGWGILALLMRQTNVFWIVVYMGGLEAVHAVKTLRPKRVDQPFMATLWEQQRYFGWRYSAGDIHDLPLSRAWPDDALFTAISLGIAAICNPGRVLRQIWPYLTVLGAFAGFVAWNGGVVLGDKSNHVATIHLAQMLYIWPFFAFFSLPLLLPIALLGIIALSGLIVRYNTIIHPFTLADNRHYMFYVFRYTIRRAAWIRYLLVVPYMISGWMILDTSAGCSPRPSSSQEALGDNLRDAEKKSPSPAELLRADPLRYSSEPMSTSTGLIFLAATSLSLVTAPLVEPRYFIIPWVMWRLHVPAVAEHLGRHDVRLVIETAWFLAVNLATCFVFLAKPYIWRAEDGSVLDDGRLQRFMW
ncbi:DIE2/ALG10 family domain-containing protein [Hirsutella rhossiliensis]|uniref:Dol-P-Glc:Glc(2)Man(9)GlcNAc(2)-PP-Dol alpha-1,2-glucosyltransferase n=1 Tax=Hirsutella rhossiliensis TaxID=111463 RepID=A0A9P8N1L4_9HYPO|nr:DIE2/ALG10 family domain-containing protein [Hirsutella rhossiliensis]KAH0966533.1 DIE2/ALG10 family domain-containing protein [Hirsutella rhossiliensis]